MVLLTLNPNTHLYVTPHSHPQVLLALHHMRTALQLVPFVPFRAMYFVCWLSDSGSVPHTHTCHCRLRRVSVPVESNFEDLSIYDFYLIVVWPLSQVTLDSGGYLSDAGARLPIPGGGVPLRRQAAADRRRPGTPSSPH